MNKALSIIVLCLLLTSCKSDSKIENDGYNINGTAPGVYNGVRAYLKTIDTQRGETIHDTAIVFDEKFTFEGKTNVPQLWYLTINSVEGSFPLMIENKDFVISANTDDLAKSTISGSKSNEALSIYTKNFNKLSDARDDLLRKNKALLKSDDSEGKAKIATQIRNLNKELTDFPLEFVSAHPDNYFSLALLESLLLAPNADFETIEKYYKALKPDLKSTDYGKRFLGQLEIIKLQAAKSNSLNIGQEAPNFSAPNPEGYTIALSDIRGKVTIIDFWASWCGPCRKENPNVVRIYQKHHEKGLEIINVSLDRPGQKDKWLKAIEDDKLTWHHVSNLNYFNDPIAKLYHINSIPATYILDASGTIVAKNLRDAALEAKIAELLD
ncbi:MAG: redoxin domain-containing protein [Gelidibacter sp.]